MIKVPGNIAFEVLADRVTILDTSSGEYFTLNGVATRTWALIHEGRTIGTVVETLASEFDAPEELVRADVDALVDRLVGRGLLEDA